MHWSETYRLQLQGATSHLIQGSVITELVREGTKQDTRCAPEKGKHMGAAFKHSSDVEASEV